MKEGGNVSINYKPVPFVETRYDQLFADAHYDEAIAFMHQFLEDNKDNPYAEMIAHINIASCYYALGQINQAFQHAMLYKQLCMQYGNQQDQYNLCHINALIYEYEQNYTKAIDAVQECIRIATLLKLHQELAESYNLYSYLQIAQENFNEALEASLYAQQLAYEHHKENLFLICQIHCNLASSYVNLGRYSEARNILMILSDNPYIQGHLRERSRYLYLRGIIHLKEKNFDEAIALFEESRAVAHSLNDLIILKNLFWHLSVAYEETRNFECAYNMMKAYGDLCDKLLKLRNNSNVADINLNYSVAVVEQRAKIDQLSGVYNRSYLEVTCNEWLQQAKKNKDHICCIVFDVDNFKSINDSYGHLVGDEVIKQLGKTCLDLISSKNEFVARYGGDEFVIILRNYSMDEVKRKSREFFDAITNTIIMYDHHVIQFTVSMGIICNSSIIANKFTQLFKVADQALYMAKHQGKNQIVTLANNNCSI